MMYFALFWIGLIALIVGSKAPVAGLGVAFVGTVFCFSVRAWLRWDRDRAAEKWKLRKQVQEDARVQAIHAEMQRAGLKVLTNEAAAPIAYVANADADAASSARACGVVRAGGFYFLTSRPATGAEAAAAKNYIELLYNTDSKSDLNGPGFRGGQLV